MRITFGIMLLATIPCNAITWRDGAAFAVGIGDSFLSPNPNTFRSLLGSTVISLTSVWLLTEKDLEARKQLALLQQQHADPVKINKVQQKLERKKDSDFGKKSGVYLCGFATHRLYDVIKIMKYHLQIGIMNW